MGFASFSACGVAKWAASDKEAGQGPGNKVSVGWQRYILYVREKPSTGTG